MDLELNVNNEDVYVLADTCFRYCKQRFIIGERSILKACFHAASNEMDFEFLTGNMGVFGFRFFLDKPITFYSMSSRDYGCYGIKISDANTSKLIEGILEYRNDCINGSIDKGFNPMGGSFIYALRKCCNIE